MKQLLWWITMADHDRNRGVVIAEGATFSAAMLEMKARGILIPWEDGVHTAGVELKDEELPAEFRAWLDKAPRWEVLDVYEIMEQTKLVQVKDIPNVTIVDVPEQEVATA